MNQKAKYDERAKLNAQYDSEPIWGKMENVMKALREWYRDNKWIYGDKEAVAVLESLRKDFEASNEKIETIVKEARDKAHEDIELKFDRTRDKKILELQLKSMQREYKTLKKFGKLNGKNKNK